ncbi:hypothetical protein [Methylobacterium durans]|nr:hypothetical protein [Methylobacterium durans]
MRQILSVPSRVRENEHGSYSLYDGDEEVISGLSYDDMVAFYFETTNGKFNLVPAEPADMTARAVPETRAGEARPAARHARRPARRRGRQLSLLPHAAFVRKAMERDPNIRPMMMALLLNQYGVKVHSLNPVRSIMAYCER